MGAGASVTFLEFPLTCGCFLNQLFELRRDCRIRVMRCHYGRVLIWFLQ
jgi:hypothetical protein